MQKRIGKRLSDVLLDRLIHASDSYDIIGDIVIVRLANKNLKSAKAIGNAIMAIHRNVKTVLAQTNPVHGEFRLRGLTHVAGEKKFHTIHRESGCSFEVDLANCYFSERLSHERKRIADQASDTDVIVNMFAGVGCFSILLAKRRVNMVFSIDINPVAVQYMEKNVRINRVYGQVVPILGDAAKIIEQKLHHVADRVLMPLPEKAFEYLPFALLALKDVGGWIHYYDFVHAEKSEDPVQKVVSKVQSRLHALGVKSDMSFGRVVRRTGPNWYQIVLDIRVMQRKTQLPKDEESKSL